MEAVDTLKLGLNLQCYWSFLRDLKAEEDRCKDSRGRWMLLTSVGFALGSLGGLTMAFMGSGRDAIAAMGSSLAGACENVGSLVIRKSAGVKAASMRELGSFRNLVAATYKNVETFFIQKSQDVQAALQSLQAAPQALMDIFDRQIKFMREQGFRNYVHNLLQSFGGRLDRVKEILTTRGGELWKLIQNYCSSLSLFGFFQETAKLLKRGWQLARDFFRDLLDLGDETLPILSQISETAATASQSGNSDSSSDVVGHLLRAASYILTLKPEVRLVMLVARHILDPDCSFQTVVSEVSSLVFDGSFLKVLNAAPMALLQR